MKFQAVLDVHLWRFVTTADCWVGVCTVFTICYCLLPYNERRRKLLLLLLLLCKEHLGTHASLAWSPATPDTDDDALATSFHHWCGASYWTPYWFACLQWNLYTACTSENKNRKRDEKIRSYFVTSIIGIFAFLKHAILHVRVSLFDGFQAATLKKMLDGCPTFFSEQTILIFSWKLASRVAINST